MGTRDYSFASAAGNAAPDLIRASTYIFKGGVRRTRAATLDLVRVNDNTVVVSVDEVLEAPITLTQFLHQEITLQLQRPMRAGEQATFFANGWLFERSIALVEVGHLPADVESALLRRQIADARQMVADERMKKVLADAALVVVGTVTDVEEEPVQGSSGQSRSEHDPLWRGATLAVSSVEKGEGKESSLPVAFASSSDVLWVGAPKLQKGLEGIFVLHAGVADEANEVKVRVSLAEIGGYVVWDALDYQPIDQLDRVRRLIAEL